MFFTSVVIWHLPWMMDGDDKIACYCRVREEEDSANFRRFQNSLLHTCLLYDATEGPFDTTDFSLASRHEYILATTDWKQEACN